MASFHLCFVLALLAILTYNPVQPSSLFNVFTSSLGTQEEVAYKIVYEGEGFEERVYPSKKWLCTRQKGGYSEGDQMDVFLRLFSYLGGENSQKRRLNMAIPVSIEFQQTKDGEIFTACFFLEEKDQMNYPEPTNPAVRVVQRPEMTVFTRKFGGYANSESTWKTEAAELTNIVKTAGEKVKPNVMFWNAYDAPFKFWNRRNEVWLVKDSNI
ncbi:hypothetical protein SK128_022096 [Halocaridina rubra]|uniref:Heme-binding protein 2 n=1 Tax=Halocaridina rubra TaxID=373956 RepID=A0AAN8XDD1_HALRR